MEYTDAVLAHADGAARARLEESQRYHLKSTDIEHPQKWYWRAGRDFIVEHVPRSELLLDVGCGFGGFSYAMQRLGYNGVFSTDVDATKLDCMARALHAVGLRDNILMTPPTGLSARFRVVSGFDFMMVLPPPRFFQMLEAMAARVENGGYLIFTLPAPENEAGGRTKVSCEELKAFLQPRGFTLLSCAGPEGRWPLYIFQKDKWTGRWAMVTVDGDGFQNFFHEFYDKVVEGFDLRLTIGFISQQLTEHRRVEDYMRHQRIELASHSHTHPDIWSDPVDTLEPVFTTRRDGRRVRRANPAFEIESSVALINDWARKAGGDKVCKGMLWPGQCRPTEAALALCDSNGLYNFNGSDEKGAFPTQRPYYVPVGKYRRYLQLARHDLALSRNMGRQGAEWQIEYFQQYPHIPAHIYLHFAMFNDPVRAENSFALLRWLAEKKASHAVEDIYVSQWMAANAEVGE